MNPNLDHLNPANWWPHYDMASDRRAIPAAALLVLDPDLNAYLHLPEGEQTDPWRHLSGFDQIIKTKAVVLEWGSAAEREVSPDFPVYIAQRDFERLRAELPAALVQVYDALWSYHQAGMIGRPAFDVRAGELRALRDIFTNNTAIYGNA